MLSIDNEEDANEKQSLNENKQVSAPSGLTAISANQITSTSGGNGSSALPAASALKQRLLEGIEKVSGSKAGSTSDNMPTTPRSSAKNRNNRKVVPNSSAKKSIKKRKRKKDCDSTDESDFKNSDTDLSD